jgi:hypothetical protein
MSAFHEYVVYMHIPVIPALTQPELLFSEIVLKKTRNMPEVFVVPCNAVFVAADFETTFFLHWNNPCACNPRLGYVSCFLRMSCAIHSYSYVLP